MTPVSLPGPLARALAKRAIIAALAVPALLPGLAFAANIMFWRGIDFGDITAVNYFGRRIHEQPLVHTWSLGVEEQFYLLYPLALLLVWRIRAALLLPFLIASALGSLVLSVWLTPGSPGLSFYLLPTRGWELVAGERRELTLPACLALHVAMGFESPGARHRSQNTHLIAC